MPYVTLRQADRTAQMTLFELWDDSSIEKYMRPNTASTRTEYVDTLKPEMADGVLIASMIGKLRDFNRQYEELFSKRREELYYHFFIPKKGSDSFRRIDAPLDDLKLALNHLKLIFEKDFGVLHHTNAFAYVKNRCTVDALKRHQQNKSHWFLKTDFDGFFPNTTQKFVMRMLGMVYPFSEIVKGTTGRQELERSISLCFLNNGLPQGTPISPLITNTMMIPIDHEIGRYLRSFEDKQYIVTRYADDILISCGVQFDHQEIVDGIKGVLNTFQASFQLNERKTRYGSRSGANWNLGLMLNKDNKVTVGHKRKEQIRARVCSFIMDTQSGNEWDLGDIRNMYGILSYYRNIEPDFFAAAIARINHKYNVNFDAMVKSVIN